MKKRISDYLFDVSKYVLAGVFIAPLFNANVCDGGAFWSSAVFAVIALLVSLFFSKQKKGGMNKHNNTPPETALTTKTIVLIRIITIRITHLKPKRNNFLPQ